jgi:ADP-ribose pyrophosphatase
MTELWEKEIESKKIFQGRLISVRVDTVEMPDGKKSTREIVEHPGAVAVIAITQDQELILVRQFRKAAGEIVLELPAGVPNKGERGEETARRELEEETGYFAKKIKKVCAGYASPGYSNEVLQFYLAEDMNKMKQKTDEDEFVEVDLIDVETCVDLLKQGKIKDNKTIVGILLAEKHLKGELW